MTRFFINVAIIPALIFSIFSVIGCQSGKAIENADKVLAKALLAHGDYLAPFHYKSAEIYLAQARSQQEHSDFKSAVIFADKALFHAQSAFNIAIEKQSSIPVPTAEPFDPASIVLSTNPKDDLKAVMDRAEQQLESLEKSGAKRCAPKEFAEAKAYFDFCQEEWKERDYNLAANYLRRVREMVELALPFMEDCEKGDNPLNSGNTPAEK